MSDFQSNDILEFQQKALDYLYDLPVVNNSFYIAKFEGANFAGDTGFGNLSYRVQKVRIQTPSINYEERETTGEIYPKGVKIPTTFTITWMEDGYNSIQKFHLGMMSSLYNFRKRLFKVGAGGSYFPQIEVVHFNYTEGVGNTTDPFDSLPVPIPTEKIVIQHAMPQSIGSLDYDYSSSGSDTIDITYSCNSIQYIAYSSSATSWMDSDFYHPATTELYLK